MPLFQRQAVQPVLGDLVEHQVERLAAARSGDDRTRGGRPRIYPAYMWLAFEALISVYESARQVEAELAHPVVWKMIRSLVAERFPDDPSMQLPDEPMRRHHYAYGRDRYLADHLPNARLLERGETPWKSTCASRQRGPASPGR